MQHVREPHEYSQIVRTVIGRGLKRHKLLYDPDVFVDDMKISVSLLSGDATATVQELDVPEVTHYNTIHLDNYELYGDSNGVILHGIPKTVSILGMKFPPANSTVPYFISSTYDVDSAYTYTWSLVSGNAVIVGGSGKQTVINFKDDGEVILSCIITNEFNGKRKVMTSIQVGSQPKKIMVVRTPIVPA